MERIRSTEDVEAFLFSKAKDFFRGKISGSVYLPETRPLNSTKEDVVVVVSALDGEQFQTGTSKINVFVKDLLAPMQQPNKKTLRNMLALADALLAYLNDNQQNIRFKYQFAPMTLKVEETQEHIANFSFYFNCITF